MVLFILVIVSALDVVQSFQVKMTMKDRNLSYSFLVFASVFLLLIVVLSCGALSVTMF